MRNERMVLATWFGEPRLVKIPRVVHGKATFQQGFVGNIVRVPQGMFAVGRRRLRRVMETVCCRATPSGPVRKVLRELRDKLKKMENVRKEQSLEQEDAKPDENGRMGGCAKDRFSRQNPAKDCGADRVLSSFAGCGGLQCFVPGHGPTTLTRLQKCAQYFQSPNFCSGPGISLSILSRRRSWTTWR